MSIGTGVRGEPGPRARGHAAAEARAVSHVDPRQRAVRRALSRPRRATRCEDARHYLELVGLWDEVKDRLKTSALALSGGQQQRLCLARTLAVRPSIVLMDEPCSALDPRATAVIEGLVRELARDYTIVIVTHNIAQARRVADHCVFMLDGEVLAAGTRDEMLIEPRHPTVRDFVTGMVG